MPLRNIFFAKNKTTNQEKMPPNANRLTGIAINEWEWGNPESQNKILTADDKEAAYKSSPKLFHGINKRARDIVYSDFKIINPDEGKDVPDKIKKIVAAFIKEHDINNKIYHAVQEAFWNGTGWLEWVCSYTDDPKTKLSGKLMDVVYVNTKTMVGEKYNKYMKPEFFIQKIGLKRQPIHASRLQPIVFYPSGNSSFGIGLPQIAQRVIKADNDATKAMGDNLIMFGHPFPVINTRDNQNEKAIDQGWDILNKLRKKDLKVGFVGFKDDKFQMLNPESPNPDAILNHFYIEFAASLEIPLQLLIGSEMSKLTGNEMELADYYKSVETYQYTVLSPIYNHLCKLLLGDEWVYDFQWESVYTDDEMQNNINVAYMNAVGTAYNDKGLIELPEARQLLRDFGINIPRDGDLDKPEDTDISELPPIPIQQEDSKQKSQSQVKIRELTVEEKAVAKKQRELGEKLIKEGAAR